MWNVMRAKWSHLLQGSYQHLWLFQIIVTLKVNKEQYNLEIALSRVRTTGAQNGFHYQGAMIYYSLTRDTRMQEN